MLCHDDMDEGGVKAAEKGEISENVRGHVDCQSALETIEKGIKYEKIETGNVRKKQK